MKQVQITGLPEDNLPNRMKTLLVYAQLCGTGWDAELTLCFSKVHSWITRTGLGKISEQLSSLPAEASYPLIKTMRSHKSPGILPIWITDNFRRLPKEPAFLPLIARDDELKIITTTKAKKANEMPFTLNPPESGYYKLAYLEKGASDFQWQWQERLKVEGDDRLEAASPTTGTMYFPPSGTLSFMFDDMPYAFTYVTDQKQSYFPYWWFDHRMKGAVNQLLLSLVTTNEPLSDPLNLWSQQCVTETKTCLFYPYQLRSKRKPVSNKKIDSLYSVPPPVGELTEYVQMQSPVTAKEMAGNDFDQWLQLLQFVYNMTGLEKTNLPVGEFALTSRKLCGLFPEPYRRSHQFACFYDVAQLYTNKKDNWPQDITRYLDSFPDTHNIGQSGIALMSIWPTYGRANLGIPRFLPVFQQKSDRSLFVHRGVHGFKTFEVSDEYEAYFVNTDYTLTLDTDTFLDAVRRQKTPTGSYVLVSTSNGAKEYSIVHGSGFHPLPRPLYQTHHPLLAHSDVDTVDTVSDCSHLPGDVAPKDRGLLSSVCNRLLQKHFDYRAFNILFASYQTFQNWLFFPEFQLVAGANQDKKVLAIDKPGRTSKILETLQELKIASDPKKFSDLRIEIRHVHRFLELGTTLLSDLTDDYVQIMREKGIRHEHEVLVTLFNYCGFMGKELRQQCASRMMKEMAHRIFPSRERLVYMECFSVNSFPEFASPSHTPNRSILTMTWYIDNKYNLSRQPSYRLAVRSRDRHGEMQIAYVDPRHTFAYPEEQPVTVSNLKPNTTYHVWKYDHQQQQWSDNDVKHLSFKTEPNKNYKDLTVNLSDMLALGEDNDGNHVPEYFFYFKNDHPDRPYQDQPESMWPAFWMQDVKMIPQL